MKQSIAAIIAAGLMCCSALIACTTNNNQTVERNPLTSTITTQPDKAHFRFVERAKTNDIKSNDGTVYASLTTEEISFVAENRADRPSTVNMNSTLSSAHDKTIEIYTTYANNLKAHLETENPDMSVFPWETKVDFNCVRNDGKAISVVETVEHFSAGANIGTIIITYNFEPETGNQIKQPFYIITDKESFDNADDVMYKKLLAKYGEEVIDYKNVASSFVEVAASCWYFTQDGVTVTFAPGSIAAEEAGTLEIEYSKEELCDFAHKYFA